MASNLVIAVTAENFTDQVTHATTPVLLDFWAEWCGPCKMIGPVIDQLAQDYQGRVKVGKVDVDAEQALAAQFGITHIPTLLVFKGGKVTEQVGGRSLKDLKATLDRALG